VLFYVIADVLFWKLNTTLIRTHACSLKDPNRPPVLCWLVKLMLTMSGHQKTTPNGPKHLNGNRTTGSNRQTKNTHCFARFSGSQGFVWQKSGSYLPAHPVSLASLKKPTSPPSTQKGPNGTFLYMFYLYLKIVKQDPQIPANPHSCVFFILSHFPWQNI
jgi:hypothetical protein